MVLRCKSEKCAYGSRDGFKKIKFCRGTLFGPLGGPKGPWVGSKTAKIELKSERLNIIMWFLWQKIAKKIPLN